MDIKVAIIVPIYNPGESIRKALQSLVNQSLREIEIICVLDGGNDGSDEYCRKLANDDPRVVVIDNVFNKGVSESRNVGIERAILDGAEYVGFMDNDDYVDLDMYNQLFSIAVKNNCDVVRCNTMIEYDDGECEEAIFESPSWKGMLQSLVLPMGSEKNHNYLSRTVWNSIYKVSLVGSKRFLPRERYWEEDTLFNLMVFRDTQNVICIDAVLYHWVKHQDSLSSKMISHVCQCNRILSFLENEEFLITGITGISLQKEYQNMISWFLRRYYHVIVSMDDSFLSRISLLLKKSKFPIWGRYEGLKFISKIRFKLLFFVLKLKCKS